tara:strand:- start:10 stop:306 length:297 start_codon:yes stop_codon:yes gene_type:complete
MEVIMSESVKFTDEEMKELKQIQESYVEVQNNLGQTQVSILRLEQQRENLFNYENSLKEKFFKVQEDEKKFIEKVTEKYGDGELNPNTGEFISQKKEK